jgi:hypothetical protein
MRTNWHPQKKQNISSKSLEYSTSKNSVKMKTPEHLFDIKSKSSVVFFKIDQNTTKDFRNSPYNKD